MKLTQFATAALIVLLAVAGYLTIKSDLEDRQTKQNEFQEKVLAKMEELGKKQPAAVPSPPPAAPVPDKIPAAAPVAPAPVATTPAASRTPGAGPGPISAVPPNFDNSVPMAAADDPRLIDDEKKILNSGANDRTATESLSLPSALDNKPLNPMQSRIVALPAIAQVKKFSDKDGINFLVLNRGIAAGFKAGDSFALRRRTAVIGRITISDTIDTSECVADLVPNSMPPGMTPVAGDDVIQFDQ